MPLVCCTKSGYLCMRVDPGALSMLRHSVCRVCRTDIPCRGGWGYTGIVQAQLMTSHMLFVGFSCEDANYQRIMTSVMDALHVDAPPATSAPPPQSHASTPPHSQHVLGTTLQLLHPQHQPTDLNPSTNCSQFHGQRVIYMEEVASTDCESVKRSCGELSAKQAMTDANSSNEEKPAQKNVAGGTSGADDSSVHEISAGKGVDEAELVTDGTTHTGETTPKQFSTYATAGRRQEIFLDYVLARATALTSAKHLLDNRFESSLSAGEAALRDVSGDGLCSKRLFAVVSHCTMSLLSYSFTHMTVFVHADQSLIFHNVVSYHTPSLYKCRYEVVREIVLLPYILRNGRGFCVRYT